jgi:hypothetical protein
VKELVPRTFEIEAKEFIQKLGLPEGGLMQNVELTPESVVVTLVGVK